MSAASVCLYPDLWLVDFEKRLSVPAEQASRTSKLCCRGASSAPSSPDRYEVQPKTMWESLKRRAAGILGQVGGGLLKAAEYLSELEVEEDSCGNPWLEVIHMDLYSEVDNCRQFDIEVPISPSGRRVSTDGTSLW